MLFMSLKESQVKTHLKQMQLITFWLKVTPVDIQDPPCSIPLDYSVKLQYAIGL